MRNRKGQAAVEYMLLYGVVVALVVVSFKYFLNKSRGYGEEYRNEIVNDINNGV